MEPLVNLDDDTEESTDFNFEDVRKELLEVGEEFDCPDLVTAYDAIMVAMNAIETHDRSQEMMSALFQKMQPLLRQAPMFMSSLMTKGLMGGGL